MRVWESVNDRQGVEVTDSQWAVAPLLRHPALNRSLIIKHRLRPNEKDYFNHERFVATKVVLPFSRHDLRAGAKYFFVDEVGFEKLMLEEFGLPPNHLDIQTLRAISAFPSLDPFLLREQLRRHGFEPAPCYFSITEADLSRMRRFVEIEIAPLVNLSLHNSGLRKKEDALSEMASKILEASHDVQMEALREALRLARYEYQEGIFCWKGFLYYKWVLGVLKSEISQVMTEVETMQPVGRLTAATRETINRSRGALRRKISKTYEDALETVAIYDTAYEALMAGRPMEFRDFLLNAPRLFTQLGDQLGAMQHVVGFWRYRFGVYSAPASVEELLDIFMDFENGFGGQDDRSVALRA